MESPPRIPKTIQRLIDIEDDRAFVAELYNFVSIHEKGVPHVEARISRIQGALYEEAMQIFPELIEQGRRKCQTKRVRRKK